MTILGLENNYYLAGNDIWISVAGFVNPVSFLTLSITNLSTSETLPEFRLYPSPNNDFKFNISAPIRALFNLPGQDPLNSLQTFEIKFVANFESATAESFTYVKHFIRGGRNKNGNDAWHLYDGAELVVGRWLKWRGVPLTGLAHRIVGSQILEFMPEPYEMSIPLCDYKIVKFLNSLGGYQYFLFEKYEKVTKTRRGKTLDIISEALHKENFRVIDVESTTTLKLYAKTPTDVQEVFADLITSPEIFLYNPQGTDLDGMWERVIAVDSQANENNFDRVYLNELEVEFSKYKTRAI